MVRLKGGDPFVLGRGGEEALACRAAGVPVEVVPGVTSAVSVPAAAGIPVTHRGITSSFALVSAHDGVQAVNEPPTSTRRARRSCCSWASACCATPRPRSSRPDAPRDTVAVIERGWTPQQRTTVGTLADIADIAEARDVASPAVVVVGDVVSLRGELGPFSPEPP